MKFTDQQFAEIASELDCGFKVYINKKTGEFKSLIDFDEYDSSSFGADEEDPWIVDLKTIEETWEDYFILKKMESSESYRIMEDFTEQVSNASHQKKLYQALNGRKPFRAFKDQLAYLGDLLDQWYEFQGQAGEQYVREQIMLEFRGDEEDWDEDIEGEDVHGGEDFDGKTFVLVKNSESGTVDASTRFEYEQEGDLVTADYFGGTVRYGKIIALLNGDKLDMLYQCLTTDGALKAGKASAKISQDKHGKMHLFLDWAWLNGDFSIGRSEYVQV